MGYSKRGGPEALRSLAFGSITNAYKPVGTAIGAEARIISWKNLTDTTIVLSWDGVTDHYIYPPSGFDTYDITANKVKDDGWFPKTGTIFYIKYLTAAPTTGSFYIQVTKSDS